MKKKVLSVVLILNLLLTLLTSIHLTVSAATEGIYTYTVSNNEATITKCNTSSSGKLIIPSTLGGYLVTRIESNSFSGCNNINNITIPNSVQSIGSYAFSKCYNLTSITIPNSVISIAGYAFYQCYNLTSITIPDSIQSIGSSAFSECYSLLDITIPNSVKIIDPEAFYMCRSLTNINVEETNNYYTSIEGVLFNKEKTTLIQYPIGKNNALYEIPNTVQNIDYMAFCGCENLTNVTLPNSVQNIDYMAFSRCKNLKKITIPDSVQSIGGSAFSRCTSLTNIALPKNLTNISNATFSLCDNLTSVTIPKNVTKIGDSAFNSCENLKIISLPNSIQSIGKYAFSCCINLTNITIPNNVASIGEGALEGCTNLTNIDVAENNKYYASVDGVLFNKEKTSLISYSAGKTNTSYQIPNCVKNIHYMAFSDCRNLNSITIPNSVQNIVNYAFYNCANLNDIYYIGSVYDWFNIYIDDTGNEYLIDATIHYVPYTESTVAKEGTSFTINTSIYNIQDSCEVIFAGYKDNQLKTIQSVPYIKETETFTYTGDLDKVKIMLWNSLGGLIPLCLENEIPQSEWIIN